MRIANPPAPYRAQNQENLKIPLSVSKSTAFEPQHETYFNSHFGAFVFFSVGIHIGLEGGIKCPEMAIEMGPWWGQKEYFWTLKMEFPGFSDLGLCKGWADSQP